MLRGLGTVAMLVTSGALAAPQVLAETSSAVEPPRVVGWPDGVRPVAPAGFSVTAFARDLDSPRSLVVLPNGDVLVAEARTVLSPEPLRDVVGSAGGETSADRVTLLRDADRDGTAERRFVLIEGLDRPSGMLLRRDRLYVASADAVWSYSFLVGQTRVNASPRKVLALPAGGYGEPWMRSLAADPDEKHLYVAVGSATGERRNDERDPHRAAILRARWDGSRVEVFASGLQNPVGMAFDPEGGRLWTVVDGRDLPGDEPVFNFLTEVREGGFYGWPDDRLGSDGDPRRADLVAPDFELGAHVAPLGLAFYGSRAFPERYRGGAFIGQHGAFGRSRSAGFGVVFVPFAGGRPAGGQEAFLTGFVKDEEGREVYGRPAGVAVARDGALLVADDGGNVIWRIAPQ